MAISRDKKKEEDTYLVNICPGLIRFLSFFVSAKSNTATSHKTAPLRHPYGSAM